MKETKVLQETKRWLSLENYESEVWKPIVGYEGIYEVSNYGRVKRLAYVEHLLKSGIYPYERHYNDRILKGSISKVHGYHVTTLMKDGIQKHHLSHRLVAEAFIPNPNNYPFINHKDETRLNNKVDNLEWCTPLYNTRYGGGIQRGTEARRKSKKGWKRVFQYSINGDFIASFESLNEAERTTGFKSISISNSCHSNNVRRFGFYWRFESDGYIYGESLIDRAKRLNLSAAEKDSIYQIERRASNVIMSTKHTLTINGETKSVSAWAHLFGKSHVWLCKAYKQKGEEYATNLVLNKLEERRLSV